MPSNYGRQTLKTVDATNRFLTHPRASQWSLKTRQSYEWTFRYLAAEDLPTETETLETLLSLPATRLSPNSLHDVWRRWRAFYRWCGQRYEVSNPIERIDATGRVTFLLEPPRRVPSLPRILSRSQLHQLLETGCSSQRDRLMVLVCLDMGLRLSEVEDMTRSALSPDGVRVTGKGRKTRIVPISQGLLTQLYAVSGPDNLWMSSRYHPLSREGVKVAFRLIFERASIKAGPHTLRHTFATTYLRRGGDVYHLSRILGHSNVRTTDIYLHLVSADLIEDHRRVSPIAEFISPMRNLL